MTKLHHKSSEHCEDNLEKPAIEITLDSTPSDNPGKTFFGLQGVDKNHEIENHDPPSASGDCSVSSSSAIVAI